MSSTPSTKTRNKRPSLPSRSRWLVAYSTTGPSFSLAPSLPFPPYATPSKATRRRNEKGLLLRSSFAISVLPFRDRVPFESKSPDSWSSKAPAEGIQRSAGVWEKWVLLPAFLFMGLWIVLLQTCGTPPRTRELPTQSADPPFKPMSPLVITKGRIRYVCSNP